MSPTIQPNEVVVADMAAYQRAAPSRWDVIVFHPTPAPGKVAQDFWVMRVIALPNEQLEFRDDAIYIDGQRQEPPARLSGIHYIAPRHSPSITYPYRVPAGSYFLLGDNTTNALDSRYWGALPREDILGRVTGQMKCPTMSIDRTAHPPRSGHRP